MIILGISAYYHDSAAAIVEDGKVLYAAQEERFTRIKNDASFPENAIIFCLQESGYDIKDIDLISFYDKPFLKFERILETYYAFAPRGIKSFTMAMPLWLKEKLFIKQFIRKKIKALSKSKLSKIPINFPEHHLSHVASAFYTSPFKKCAYLTVDGVGEWATTSYGIACGEKGIKVLGELHFPDSIGLFYSSFTYFLGFEVNSGEYKMMGLAPYALETSLRVQDFIQIIKNNLVDIKPDGSIKLVHTFFEYSVGLQMVNPIKWEKLFGIKKRLQEDKLEQVHADLALAAQKVTEEILTKLITFVKQETGQNNLCLAGGVALNCVANSVLFDQNIFDNIFVQPAAGDAGGALGAAMAAAYITNEKLHFKGLKNPFNVYLGTKCSNQDIERLLRKNKCTYQFFETDEALTKATAKCIAEKKVIG
jgi:carbamoyltransferase